MHNPKFCKNACCTNVENTEQIRWWHLRNWGLIGSLQSKLEQKYTFMRFFFSVFWTMCELCPSSYHPSFQAIHLIRDVVQQCVLEERKHNNNQHGPWFNIKMLSYQYRKSYCGDKTVVRSSYLPNGIFYTGKMTSLYWIRVLVKDWLASRTFSLKLRPKWIYGMTT